MSKLTVRKNIRHLSRQELDDLIKAFVGIQALDPKDPNSFFMIAGYHGEPFRGAGYGNAAWWGGYCNHGNVLFPTWHRAYLHRLENALQTIVPGFAMAYWDETEEESTDSGIPEIFLMPKYQYADGSPPFDNPLYSYKFQKTVEDRLKPFPDADYSKPKNYQTVRYPFSGLVGKCDLTATTAHNKALEEMGIERTTAILNDNIKRWLNKPYFYNHEGKNPSDPEKNKIDAGVKHKYGACLNAPNYTVFSNTTSAQQWNDDNKDVAGYTSVVPLEAPHNSMHLAVGGFELKDQNADFDKYPGANGDMGENDTASFDPIFYFHHCWIDLVFYEWQKMHNAVESFEIISGYPGTNSVDNQGPTPGVAGGTWLTLDSALDPFKKPGSNTEPMTSRDVANPTKLGYTYAYNGGSGTHNGTGHVGKPVFHVPQAQPAPVIEVSGVNRAAIGGSFMINAWYEGPDGKSSLIGNEAVLSRWHTSGCANCQNHLEVKTHIALHGWTKEQAEKAENEKALTVTLHCREPLSGHGTIPGTPSQPKPRHELLTGHMG